MNELTETIAVEQVPTLTDRAFEKPQGSRGLLADLLTSDEILIDDYKDLKTKTWPSLPLDEFQEKYGVPELSDRKKRLETVPTQLSRRIRRRKLTTLTNTLTIGVQVRTQYLMIQFLKCVKTKLDFDKTKQALQEIWVSKSLEYGDYLDFEEFAIESLVGADLEDLRRGRFVHQHGQKADSIENIKKIEQQWMPGLISEDELNSSEGLGEDVQSHLALWDGVPMVESIPLFGQVSSFAGFSGLWRAPLLHEAHIQWRTNAACLCFLLCPAARKVENLVLLLVSKSSKKNSFDQIVLLKRNANLEGPSTNTKIKASLKVSQRLSFKVVRQVNGRDWYEMREFGRRFTMLGRTTAQSRFGWLD